MFELDDAAPEIAVQPAEYTRLLGYPRGHVLDGRAAEIAAWARDWYRQHGRPWVYVREAARLEAADAAVRIEGVPFASARLAAALHDTAAERVMLVAVSAGPELEDEAQRRWQDGKPDEYFFLEVYGSAIVEHLVTMTGARLCAWADAHGLAMLPHDSPGYPDWTSDDQAPLLATMTRARGDARPLAVEVLESGMLRPKKSLLAVFGVTALTDRVRRLTELVPCERCSFLPCQYRRAPYHRTPRPADPELSAIVERGTSDVPSPLTRDAAYTVNPKALRRWTEDRLSIERQPDGSVHARFRYEGTTCTNMGRPLEFHYAVVLGARDEGYPILEQRCEPAPGDRGHVHMCRYLTGAGPLMAAIREERPLAGRSLDEVIGWARQPASAGCFCEPASRTYKWGLVLETLHYALVHLDAASSPSTRETSS
jgi:hypothetical protein